MQEQPQQQEQQGQAHHRPPPPLPPEILSPIFAHLPLTSLLSCALVSRLWYYESKSHLFSAETFQLKRLRPQIPPGGTKPAQALAGLYSPAYIAAIKDNKRYLRSVACHLTTRSDLSIAEVLEILFDCPRELLPFSVDETNSGDTWNDLDRAAAVVAAIPIVATIADDNGAAATMTATPSSSKVVPSIPLGPNRPALQVFMYDGEIKSTWLFETMIYNLPTLTTLDIHLGQYYPDLPQSICLDIDMILDSLPRLKSLVIAGYGHHYADNAPSSSVSTTATTGTTTMQLHPLESFKFTPLLTKRSTANTLATFRRLGNLKSIFISAKYTYDPVIRQAKPGEFGQILQRCCPKIERVETNGSLALWLCRLPPSPPPFEDIRSLSTSGTGTGAGTRELYEGPDVILRHQEREDFLTNYQEFTLFFPQLKALIAEGYQTVGAQDLHALTVSRSPFLTHLEIGNGNGSYWSGAFELLQDTRPYLPSPSVEGIDQITVYPPGPMAKSEKRWMRWRRECSTLDYQRVLETCSALRVVSLPYGIPFRHMVDDSSDTDGVGLRMTRRWACEGTIETLHLGFVLSTARRDDHRLIWRHLGRLRKLRCLTLKHSNLIPSLDFGISELVGRDFSQHVNDNHDDAPLTGEGEGERDDQQRLRVQNTTLEKIHSIGVAWGVDDRATTQWFARSFPNLQTAELGFRWGTDQHKRVQGWLDEVGCSLKLEFTNDRYRRK